MQTAPSMPKILHLVATIAVTTARWTQRMTMTTTVTTTMDRHISLVVITAVSIRIRHQRFRHYRRGTFDKACRLSVMVRSTWTRRGGPSLFLRFVFQFCLFALHSWPDWSITGSDVGVSFCLSSRSKIWISPIVQCLDHLTTTLFRIFRILAFSISFASQHDPRSLCFVDPDLSPSRTLLHHDIRNRITPSTTTPHSTI
jgi:hypothetical protein